MKYPQLVSMPSAVSDWLEEQLEARGIDAVVYTRYVLSLLYRDPVDIICPDQDLHFTNPNKEVRRTGGGRKRFCRSTDYWGHAYADTEQLKRSAAVECLKSASDQKCGIESLVDELCEKLKQIKSDSSGTKSEPLSNRPTTTTATGSEQNRPNQDPAKQYYAAFPALSRNTTSPNLITLIPKWFGSPKKRGGRSRQNRSSSYEDKLHFKADTDMKARSVGKQRFNYFSRNKKELGYCRNVTKSIERPDTMSNEWDFYSFNNNNNNIVRKNKASYEETAVTDGYKTNLCEWQDSEENMMYDDLPVDIRDLLDSPAPQDVNIDLMNMANMRDTGTKKFLQCGTNILSSIWSTDAPMEDATIYDNAYNSNKADCMLDLKFSSISIDKNVWSSDVNIIKENETNSFFESCSKKLNAYDFNEGPWSIGRFERWSETDSYDSDSPILKSLMKLNHNREESSFMEVMPRPSRPYNLCKKSTYIAVLGKVDDEVGKRKKDEKDDLLNSVNSHFKPINEKSETRGNGQYADGTTFVIPNSLDKVNFKRSASGTMYLEADYAMSKKYVEYKKVNDELTLKFNLNLNDKACQTDGNLNDSFELSDKEEEEFYFPGDHDLLNDEEREMEQQRPDSMMAEIFGKFELKCEKCNNNDAKDSEQRNIWSGGEVCMACLGLGGATSQERNQLREDVTQDGEQLLSDLSSLQKSYMEELPVAELTCNINDLIEGKEFKEEPVPIHSSSFSFATRLQQDCLMKMATIPTLRSVTL